ncbi:MAG: hypothetical protein FWG80_02765 [Alphaproteobacteria bacterium]|nr:hypothetical protein [Alphaproteobacteria bacterium]
MKALKLYSISFACTLCLMLCSPARANLHEENLQNHRAGNIDNVTTRRDAIRLDTEDPLFFARQGDFLFKTQGSFGGTHLRASENLLVGINNSLNLFADIKYQQNFDGPDDGFSGFGFGMMYRFNNGPFLSDVFAGLELAGNSKVPEFANNIWSGGVRIGRQWSWLTLSATGKSSWIFDEMQGMAYLNFIPEAYLRITRSFTLGVYSDLRKSTDPSFDREWLGGKAGIRYGRTFYTVFADYEFQMEEWRGGFRLNLLF